MKRYLVYPLAAALSLTSLGLADSPAVAKDLLAAAPSSLPTTSESTIAIADPTLETAIRIQIGKLHGALTTEDAARLTELDLTKLYEPLALALLPAGESLATYQAEAPGVRSLEGLQHFPNLKSLTIEWDYRPFHIVHEIRDLTPLQGLKGLTELTLRGQPLQSFDAVGKITSLKRLKLIGVRLTDARALGTLTALEELDLENNMLRNVSGLGTLASLRSLRLNGNPLDDVSALAGLKQLEQLSIDDLTTWGDDSPPPLDLAPLSGLATLTELSLWGARVADAGPLASLARLESLTLSQNPNLRNIDALASLTELKRLELTYVGLDDPKFLAGLTKLETLHVNMNQLTTLEPLANLDRLAELRADYNRLTSIAVVNELPELHTATFAGNPLVSFEELTPSEKLTSLNVERTVVDYREGTPSAGALRRLQEAGTEVVYTTYDPFPDILFRAGDPFVYARGRMIPVSALPFNERGRYYVPLRFVSEALGAAVEWDDATRGITVRQGDRILRLTIGTASIEADGTATAIDAAPKLVGDVAFVPVRFVSEQLGMYVQALPEGGAAITKL
jgi:Leucine-rich repeat (LRR) protein